MPFTFARWLDPQIQFEAVQATMTAAMLTVGLVRPDKDASEGEMWDCVKDAKLISWKHQARNLAYLRRFALRGDSKNSLGVMWIGAQLNGRDYRITCNLLTGPERKQLAAQLASVGRAIDPQSFSGDAFAYKARSIRLSNWAGRAPTASNGADNDALPRAINVGSFYANAMAPTPIDAQDHQEAIEEEIYANA